jgi:hypothetical protein
MEIFIGLFDFFVGVPGNRKVCTAFDFVRVSRKRKFCIDMDFEQVSSSVKKDCDAISTASLQFQDNLDDYQFCASPQ